MTLKDLILVLNRNTILDISAIDSDKNKCETFSCTPETIKKKYLKYYVAYVCPEESYLSFCSLDSGKPVCLLLDIYKSELEADRIISGC